MDEIKMPKITFITDGTTHAMRYMEETISRLIQVSGCSIEELIQKFEMGYTLQEPITVSMSLNEVARMIADNETNVGLPGKSRYSGVRYKK